MQIWHFNALSWCFVCLHRVFSSSSFIAACVRGPGALVARLQAPRLPSAPWRDPWLAARPHSAHTQLRASLWAIFGRRTSNCSRSARSCRSARGGRGGPAYDRAGPTGVLLRARLGSPHGAASCPRPSARLSSRLRARGALPRGRRCSCYCCCYYYPLEPGGARGPLRGVWDHARRRGRGESGRKLKGGCTATGAEANRALEHPHPRRAVNLELLLFLLLLALARCCYNNGRCLACLI